ncbi:MAG: HAD family phosphatase [Bacteroidetes bacterium]|nr:MAG: HAD family phosphatase [Bacteroidota bacterium]
MLYNYSKHKITTLIFDLGGVILNLNQNLTWDAFKKLGANEELFAKHQSLFWDVETGKISGTQFLQTIAQLLDNKVDECDIEKAWNAMLLDLPKQRLEALAQLKQTYNICLFSNTNPIHIHHFNNYLQVAHANANWFGLFNHIYYSFEMGYRKPDKAAFEYLLKDAGYVAEACIFIDDTPANLEGASQVGIHTLLAQQPFDEELQLELQEKLNELSALAQ